MIWMRGGIKMHFKLKLQLLSLVLLTALTLNTFGAVVSDNDGSAFITKTEFDSLKSTFQSQIDEYNTTIDAKIDSSIANYLSGLKISQEEECELLTSAVKSISFFTRENWMEWKTCFNQSLSNGSTSRVSTWWSFVSTNAWGSTNYSYLNFKEGRQFSYSHTTASSVFYFYPRIYCQDDGNEFWYVEPIMSATCSMSYTTTNYNRWREIKGLTSNIGSISRVLLCMRPGLTAYTTMYNPWHAINFPPEQAQWMAADPGYAGRISLILPEANNGDVLRFRVNYKGASGAVASEASRIDYFHFPHSNYTGFWDASYFQWAGNNACSLRAPNNATSTDMRYVMFGSQRSSIYIGAASYAGFFGFSVSPNAYKWGSGGSSFLIYAYSYHTKASGWQRSRCINPIPTTYTGGCYAMTPEYAAYGSMNSFKNYCMALAGYDLGVCDGVPLFKANISGVMNIKLSLSYYSTAISGAYSSGEYSYWFSYASASSSVSGAAKRTKLHLKIGKFGNVDGNGSTLKLCNSEGLELKSYAQNIIPNVSDKIDQYNIYIPVKRDEVVYVNIDPVDYRGLNYCKIINATATVKSN